MATPDAPAPGFDTSTPSIARVYDFMLGGTDNYEVDRQASDALDTSTPEVIPLARANRAYLTRAVRYVAHEAGVRQFIDLGSGLPTAENTHQIAQAANPGARVVYVDHDPIVGEHGKAVLADNPNTVVIHADLCDVERVLADEGTRRLIDFDEPVCLMTVSLLHCIPDDADPFGTIARYLDRLAPGSHLVFSHIVSDDGEAARSFTEQILSFGTPWGRVRSPQEAEKVFGGLTVLEPGIVECSTWRSDAEPVSRPPEAAVRLWEHAGVAVKP